MDCIPVIHNFQNHVVVMWRVVLSYDSVVVLLCGYGAVVESIRCLLWRSDDSPEFVQVQRWAKTMTVILDVQCDGDMGMVVAG